MKLLRHYPLLAFLLVMVSIIGVSVTQHSVAMALVAGALAVMSWFVTEGPRGRTLPAWVSNILVVAVSLNVIVDVVQNPGDLLGVLARFSVWLTIIKLYERRNARDHAQLLMLSLLMMLTGCMNSADLLFGLVVVLYAVLGLYVLLLHQVYSAYEGNRIRHHVEEGEHVVGGASIRPIMGRRMGLHFRSTAALLVILGLGVSSFVFVAFPRGLGKSSLISFPQLQSRQETGFSDSIDLTSGSFITESRKPVMRVRLLDSSGRPYRPDEVVRLRGAVLDRYRGGGKWAPSGGTTIGHSIHTEPGSYHSVFRSRDTADVGVEAALSSPDTYTLEVDSFKRLDRLFSLRTPAAIETTAKASVVYDPSTEMIRVNDDSGRFTYRMLVLPNPSESEQRALTSLPRIGPLQQPNLSNAPIQRIAKQLLRGAGMSTSPPSAWNVRGMSPFEWAESAVRVFMQHLQSDQFSYTIDLSDVQIPSSGGFEVDPIEYFLTTTHRGHCEYFASALAAMCYNVGIESRVITGYTLTYYDEIDQQFMVLESNAHAWVEVRTGPLDWTTFDPTPPGVISTTSGDMNDLGDQLRSFYDQFDGSWSSNIVDFDESSQVRLAETFDLGITDRLGTWASSIRSWMMTLRQRMYLGPAVYIWLGVISLPLIVGLVALIKVVRRRMRVRRSLHLKEMRRRDAHRMLRQLGFYTDTLEVLRRSGEAKPDWYPPMAFARTVEDRRPEIQGTLTSIMDLFYRGRYGADPLSRGEVKEARELVQRLASEVQVRWRG